MYKLYKHQKRVNGEWVDDDDVTPSIDANGTRNKVISFTSDASCYNGEVTDERWVDDGIIEADCFQKFDDYDDTKQEYLGCFDERTPSVTVRGGKPNGEVIVRLVNDNGVVSGEKIISLNADGNGYIELESGDAIAFVCAKWNEPSCVAEISGCYVCYFGTDSFSELNDVGTLIISCSIYRRANASGGIFYFRGTNIIFNGFDTSNVTSMEGMFASCSNLTSLNVSSFDTSNVTDMSNMFSNCSSLTALDVSNFNTSNVTSMEGMFVNCNSLTSLDLSNFNTSNVTRMVSMFNNCGSLTSLDVSNFNTSMVTNMSNMFGFCTNLTSLDLSNFNTSNVDSMSYMFDCCQSITSLDLSHFDTSKVTSMRSMFNRCINLTSLDLNHFNTSNVTNMHLMFDGCSGLTSLNLSKWDTSNVTDMDFMFQGCKRLSTIRMVNCNQTTIDKIKAQLSKVGILGQVTIITE